MKSALHAFGMKMKREFTFTDVCFGAFINKHPQAHFEHQGNMLNTIPTTTLKGPLMTTQVGRFSAKSRTLKKRTHLDMCVCSVHLYILAP